MPNVGDFMNDKIFEVFDKLQSDSIVRLIYKNDIGKYVKLTIDGNKTYIFSDETYKVDIVLDEIEKVYNWLKNIHSERIDLIIIPKSKSDEINNIEDLSYITAVLDSYELVDGVLKLTFSDADVIEFYKSGKQKLKRY